MSVKLTVAGTITDLEMSARMASLGSGTPTTPRIRLDRGEGIVRSQHRIAGQSVEQRRLAGIGQADDADG